MACTLSQVVKCALADLGQGQHAALAPELRDALDEGSQPKPNGAAADVALVLVRAITALGDIDVDSLPEAREIWAVVPADADRGAFVDALPSRATGRATRIYHSFAVAEFGEPGLVLRKVVKGKSGRDVARIFGVPCFAGPDLAEWREPDADV